jgi:hypothetical protein
MCAVTGFTVQVGGVDQAGGVDLTAHTPGLPGLRLSPQPSVAGLASPVGTGGAFLQAGLFGPLGVGVYMLALDVVVLLGLRRVLGVVTVVRHWIVSLHPLTYEP